MSFEKIKTSSSSLNFPDAVLNIPLQLTDFTQLKLGKVIMGNRKYKFEQPQLLNGLERAYQERLHEIMGFVSHYITGPPFEFEMIIEAPKMEQSSIRYKHAIDNIRPASIHIQAILLTDLVPLEYAQFVAHHDIALHAYRNLTENQAIEASVNFILNNLSIFEPINSFYQKQLKADKTEKLLVINNDLLVKIISLANYDYCYLVSLYKKFQAIEEQKKIEKEARNEGKEITAKGGLRIGENFEPSARLDAQKRKQYLGAMEYADLLAYPEYLQAAKEAELWCNPMDGGLGTSVGRDEYLEQIWPRIYREGGVKIGAKGTDLYFEFELSGKDNQGNPVKVKELVSVTEMKYLQILITTHQYGKVKIQELVNHESIAPMRKFLETPCIWDRIDKSCEKVRTYREVIKEISNLEVSEDYIMQAALPNVDKETEQLSIGRDSPGSHGQLGSMALQDTISVKLEDKVLIRAIYNGDGPNNFPDAYIVGWMAKERIPLVMLSTTKTAIDKKGGQIGVEFIFDQDGALESVKVQMMERAQAQSADKDTKKTLPEGAKFKSQEAWFYRIGLPGTEGDEGAEYAQYFNTNTALINYSVLTPFIKDLFDRNIITMDQFIDIVTPDLIQNTKVKDGKEYIQLEGALGSAL